MSQLQHTRSEDPGEVAGKDELETVPIDAAVQSNADAFVAFSEDDDFFCILGISPEATVAEIRSAFRRQARRYHPDKAGEDSKEAALSNFRYVQAAYEVLSDDTKRRLYTTYGHQIFATVLNDPLLRQLHNSVIFDAISSLLKPFGYINAFFKDGQQSDIVFRVLTNKRAVVGCMAASCIVTLLLLALISGLLTLTFGVSLVSMVGFVVSTVLAILSGAAFALLWCLLVHHCVVHQLVQSILRVIEQSQAQQKTSSATSPFSARGSSLSRHSLLADRH